MKHSKLKIKKQSAYFRLFILFFMTSFSISAYTQNAVTGNVMDQKSEPIIGATITVKNKPNVGTITDLNGDFKLNASSGEVLIISYIGYVTQELPATPSHKMNIILKEDNLSLDEVVVVGYGTQRKEELTSSISSVKADNFVQVSAPDPASLIRGKVAGLAVISPDANPLSSSQISLRGTTTLRSGTNPLVIIDGIQGDLNSISPNDIEQIDVLKDGSAAAIYGTRGTNGVILITTKSNRGEIKPTIEINSYLSTQKITKKLPMMTVDQYLAKVKEGVPGAVDNGGRVDWLDEILQTPFNQTYSINIKGGTINTSYVASFDYTSNEGLVKQSKVDVIYPRINVVHRMFDNKLKIEANINGYQRKYGIPYSNDVYQSALIFNPTDPIKDTDGNWTEKAKDMLYNPVALLNETKGENKSTNLRMYSTVTLTPIKGLDIKYLISNETYNHFAGYYETKKHKSGTMYGKNGYASRSTTRNENTTAELTAQYTKQFNNAHHLNALIGYSWNKWNYQTAFLDNYDFPTDDYSYNNMSAGNALKEGKASESSYQSENKLIGYFVRLNYNYKGKYLVSASLRHEGSSKFGTDHKWGNFPAISLGWNIKNESFLEKVDFVSALKIRAGFGITGTDPSDPYMSLNKLNLGGYGYFGGKYINLLRPDGNPNPELRWEKKEEFNIGIDFGFFNNRITGSIDLYNRDTKDLIGTYQVPVPPYVSSTITANAGSIRNRGAEIALNFVPIQNKGLMWQSGINFSTNQNKLLSLSNDKFVANSYSDEGHTLAPIQQTTHRIQEGEPIGNFYGYKSIDIDDNGHWIIEGADGKPKPISEQQASDKKILGNGIPNFYLNWNNTIQYKQFDLSLTMRGAFGFQILNMAEMNYAVPTALGGSNIMQKAFDNVYGKRPLAYDQELQYVSYYVQDGDYWKIDNLTIGYTPKIKENKWIKRARIYGSISNLLTITGYSGIDPEVNISGLTPGTDDRYRYPSARTFTLGINLTF